MKVVFIYLLGFSTAIAAAERLDEDIAKALIIRQLLNLIEVAPKANESQSNPFQLCTYQDKSLSQVLTTHLDGLTIRQKPLQIINVRHRDRVAQCNAIFINKPNETELNWFLRNQLPLSTLFIINGRRYAARGFQVGLYLNQSKSFNIEINPDVLIAGRQIPRTDLLRFGEVINSDVEKKVKLLRTLINFTDWPVGSSITGRNASFNLCTLANQSLSVFIQHFAGNKSFKGKTLNNRLVNSVAETKNCDALVIDELKDLDSLTLLTGRAKSQILLIGDQPGLGEQGVHYNLSVGENDNQSFEINLIAFEQSGHSAHFDLINSGYLVDRDYPEFSRLLESLIVQTRWPGPLRPTDGRQAVKLCVFQDPDRFAKLSVFLRSPQYKDDTSYHSMVSPTLVQDVAMLSHCEALLVGRIEPGVIAQVLSERRAAPLLLISGEKVEPPIPYHYQLLMEPRKILLKLNVERLKAAGFIPAQNLMLEIKASGGSAR